ncbi:MAG: hypothetical protein OEZ36_10780, partial [Spirochaetota bacterium]|nr:hypothetical protein [Spirochaetota bacterium]
MTRKIILLLFILTAFAMSACDPDDMESCDKTLTESEVNNSISSANDFSIMLKNGCKVEIKGYVDGVDTDDFFKVNTGDANNVFIT